MLCNEAILLLSPYVDGELPEEKIIEIKSHLESCDKCRNEAQLINKMKEYGPRLEFPVPLNIGEIMVKGVESSNEGRKTKKPLPRWIFYWKIYLVIILLVILFMLISNGIKNRTPNPTADEVMDCSYEYESDSYVPDYLSVYLETDEPEPTKAPESTAEPKSTAELTKASVNNIRGTDITAAFEGTPKPAEKSDSADGVLTETAETPRASSTPNPLPTPKPSATPNPSATTAPKTDLQKKKDSALAYSPSKVGSLQKLKVNFLLYNDEEEDKALSIYNSLSSKDVAGVGAALSGAGIVYSRSTVVLDDYSSEYNKIVDEINAIKTKISAATTEGEVDRLAAQINTKKDELAAVKKKVTTQTGITIRR